jgi:hypothetical protein
MLKIIKLTLALFVVVFFSTCKKECCQDPSNPKCENYDPCYGKREIKINFRVTKAFNGFPGPPPECPYESRDTLYNITNVRFEAPKNNLLNSTYFWQVGTDTNIRKGKAIEVGFQNWVAQGNWEKQIPVTLTIRTPYNGCMNINDTLVKVTRNIMLSQKYYGFGILYGRWDNQNFDDTFKMAITKEIKFFKGMELALFGTYPVFINAPFSDTFLLYSTFNLNQPECEKRNLNSLSQPKEQEGYVSAYQTELLNYPFSRWKFWVKRPNEQEKVYTFTGKLIGPEIQL